MSKVQIDGFTQRILKTFEALIERREIKKKKEFTDTISVTHSYYWQMENGERNFPLDKRTSAKINLANKYGVNPLFLESGSQPQFIREANPVYCAVDSAVTKMNFGNKVEKNDLLKKIAELETELKALRKAQGNSDNNSDKTES